MNSILLFFYFYLIHTIKTSSSPASNELSYVELVNPEL